MKTARSYRLPLMVALPVVAVLIAGGVYLALTDESTPAPQPNVEPEPKPLGNDTDHPDTDEPLDRGPDIIAPDRYPDSPDSPTVAASMTTEAFAGLELIRSRLELKFKYADYKHNPAWTIEGIIRRPERLESTYFSAKDYSLSFPENTEPVALLEVGTFKQTPLPDGPISILVDLRTGESTPEGFVLARDNSGRVLLPDEHYAAATRLLLQLASSWQQGMQMPEELRSNDREIDHYLRWYLGPFDADDLAFGKEIPNGVEFSLRTFHGHALAWPAVIKLDSSGTSGEISHIPSSEWAPIPSDRSGLVESLDWALADSCGARLVMDESSEATPDTEVTVTDLLDAYELRRTTSCFADWTFERGETQHTLTLNSSYGRALPFGRLRYVYDSEKREGKFLDP